MKSVLAILALVLFVAGAASAQATYITGTVTDSGGSRPIGGASVTALQGDRVVGHVATDGSGQYRLHGLQPGTYSVSFRALGFRPATNEGVTVAAGTPTTLNVSLAIQAAVVENVVVVVGGVEQKASDFPAPVFSIEQRLIAERPTTSVVEHVATIPGVDIVRGGIVQSNVVTRGFNNIFSGTLLQLTDNRFAFVPSLRVNVPYLIPTSDQDLERIEVILGPASALYGPNAAQGVMHLITKSPFESTGGILTLDGGNRSLFRGAGRYAATINDRLAYKFSFDYLQAEDFESVDLVEQSENTVRDFDIQKLGLEARMDFRPTEETDVVFTFGRAQAGSAIEPTGLGAAQVKDWVFNTYQIRASRNRLFGQIFFNQSDAGDTFLLRNRTNPDGGRIIDKSTQLVGQLQHGTTLVDRLDLIYGLDYQLTKPETEGTINGRNEDDDNVTETGAYLQATAAITPMLDLVGAIRGDKHSRLDDVEYSPRAALVFKPWDGQAFRVAYNRAFSTPSSNNQFLDLQVGAIPIPGTPGYTIRTLGTPSDGFDFNRSCTGGVGTGLCMRSPFVPGSPFMPANAGAIYQTVALPVAIAGGLRNALIAQGLSGAQADGVIAKLQGSPAPTNVGTQLRVLNPTTARFEDVTADYVRDLDAIQPTITNSFEVGYTGIIGNRLGLSASIWQQRRENFVGPLIVETPHVFLDRTSLATYLTTTLSTGPGALPAAQAAALGAGIAASMAGLPNAAGTPTSPTGIPLGVVNLNHALNNPTDVVLAYRNFGDVDLWGMDYGAEIVLTDEFSLVGSWSYASDDFFPRKLGEHDIALNAPTQKGSAGVQYRNTARGFSAEVRSRYVHAFPANSGVYIGWVPNYTLVDATVSLRPFRNNRTLLSIVGTNIGNKKHIEFTGGAELGALVVTRLQYAF
jgi:iron complex outermembrane receptor protein